MNTPHQPAHAATILSDQELLNELTRSKVDLLISAWDSSPASWHDACMEDHVAYTREALKRGLPTHP